MTTSRISPSSGSALRKLEVRRCYIIEEAGGEKMLLRRREVRKRVISSRISLLSGGVLRKLEVRKRVISSRISPSRESGLRKLEVRRCYIIEEARGEKMLLRRREVRKR
jgi:hypothetical protein